jgi:hypothetical protein
MIVGSWDVDRRMVAIEVCKGMHLDTMGIRGRVDLLYPEEMLFLVDRGRMCLYLPNCAQPASIEECMVLVLENGVTLEEYLVYSHLKSLGNIVFRHGVIGSFTSETKLIISFDVWMPRKSGELKWTRKNPVPPSFHLIVSRDASYTSASQHSELENIFQMVSQHQPTLQSSIKIATCSPSGIIDFFDCLVPSYPET